MQIFISLAITLFSSSYHRVQHVLLPLSECGQRIADQRAASLKRFSTKSKAFFQRRNCHADVTVAGEKNHGKRDAAGHQFVVNLQA